MKKSLIYLVVFLFLVKFALADIAFNPIERDKYNVGEKVSLKGSLLLDNGGQGSLNVNLNCVNESLTVYFTLFDLGPSEPYFFNIESPTKSSLIGSCNLFAATDGLTQNFKKTSESFSITDKLNVDVVSDKILALPGDVILISGSVRMVSGDVADKGTVSLSIDGENKAIDFKDGLFELPLQLNANIKSGKHDIVFTAEDDKGNKGQDETNFKVSQVPTNINLDITGSPYSPGDSIQGSLYLYDQAGDLIDAIGTVEVYNTAGDIEFSMSVASSGSFEFKLDQFSIPGTWRLNAKFDNIETNKNVEVNEVKNVDTWLEGSVLFVRNIGNVDYIDPIQINLESGNNKVDVVKETVLKPNQTIQFDLSKEVSEGGEYSVKTLNNGITGNVIFQGKSKIGSTIAGWVAIGFLFVFFIFMVFRVGKKLSGTYPKRDIKEVRELGRNTLERRKLVNVAKEPTKESDVLERKYSKDDELRKRDIDYFVNKVRRENPYVPQKKKDSSSDNHNMFRIFE